MTDKETGDVIERGIWNPDPANKDDLYVCLYNPDKHHVHEPDVLEDRLDVYQLEEVLTPSMYQQLQSFLFDKNESFTFELKESDFSMPPAVMLEDEIRYETMRQKEATKKNRK
ncbi:hypothetical protein [Lentibacillus amyloliquefaciens]|nr:hypothetical protein [Lentibacillus amyloliquefaciens]